MTVAKKAKIVLGGKSDVLEINMFVNGSINPCLVSDPSLVRQLRSILDEVSRLLLFL